MNKKQFTLFNIEELEEELKKEILKTKKVDKNLILLNIKKRKMEYDEIHILDNGFVKIKKNNIYSLLDQNCNIISDKFINVNFIFYFSMGFILLKNQDLYSVFNEEGSIISPLLENKDYIFFTKEKKIIVIHQNKKRIINLEELI